MDARPQLDIVVVDDDLALLLAASALEHGIPVVTLDSDFRRFRRSAWSIRSSGIFPVRR